ncbi:MAG: metal-dependent hydrolase [Gammaproteobacteria bacterium]|nr:metal-dependent hydrolase [Gammaproteobacteria bacterium]
MDSLTQIALGASVAAACAPRGHRRKALLAGAALGTLPDLDVFIDFGGAVENFTFHRGFSHSLFVLAPASLLLWWTLKHLWAPVREAPGRWLAAISLTLLTHPLLDAHTAYGTQLFWPMTVPPTSWATLFIIDPLYTLPLLIGVLLATFWPARRWSDTNLRAGLAVSTLYLAWSWTAHGIVTRHADAVLAEAGLDNAPVFITPTPFNTLLWRVVVRTPGGYLEGFDSLLVEEQQLEFRAYASDTRALDEAGNVWAVERLRWFARDFVKAEVENGRLVISDLRMGQEPHYVFRHVVAARGNPHWQPVTTQLLPFNIDQRALGTVWQRLWAEGN